jgi:hypothetical protein
VHPTLLHRLANDLEYKFPQLLFVKMRGYSKNQPVNCFLLIQVSQQEKCVCSLMTSKGIDQSQNEIGLNVQSEP